MMPATQLSHAFRRHAHTLQAYYRPASAWLPPRILQEVQEIDDMMLVFTHTFQGDAQFSRALKYRH